VISPRGSRLAPSAGTAGKDMEIQASMYVRPRRFTSHFNVSS
jgi:hypothetical protein